MRKSPAIFVAAAAALDLFAATIAIPPVPPPTFADTEVSTNIAIRADDDHARSIEITFALPGDCASNCLQVAFGRDLDENGLLDFDETTTLFGWRNGRRFAEGVMAGVRIEEETSGIATSRAFTVGMELSKGSGLRNFSAVDESDAPAFADLAANPPAWLYDPAWNMMRVTRRGPGVPAEWFSCAIRPHFISMILH